MDNFETYKEKNWNRAETKAEEKYPIERSESDMYESDTNWNDRFCFTQGYVKGEYDTIKKSLKFIEILINGKDEKIFNDYIKFIENN